MIALTIATTSLRRYLRDRTALFFLVVLPILVIVLIGTTVTGFNRFRIGIVMDDRGPLAVELADALDASPALEVHRFSTVGAASTATRRGEVAASVVVPAGFDERLRRGEDQEIRLIADRASTSQQAASSAVASVVADQAGRVQAAHFAARHVGGTFADALALTDRAHAATTSLAVELITVDEGGQTLPEGFSYSAPTMLVLFVFINALAGGAAVIESRRLGIYQRVTAAPVPARSIVVGETACYFAMAMLQSLLIVSVGAVVFGVDWGDPIGAGALICVWALVGTGAGVVSGTLFRTPEQASSIGPSVGIAFGMLGGCMWPLEIVPRAMRTVGHLVPHGWAIDAWTALLSREATLAGIAGELTVLLGFAVALLIVATLRLRRAVSG